MAMPLNAAAETIVRLREHNSDIQTQIDALDARRSQNTATIDALEPVAEWEDDE